ncbi:MAG: ThiF family adenylyltransferase [bacterium]|nr:ThiF family adenylyltransferase [bacterium]
MEKILKNRQKGGEIYKPEIYDLSKKDEAKKFEKLLKNGVIDHVSDDYVEQLREYFGVMNPSEVYKPTFAEKFSEYIASIQVKQTLQSHGVWVFYPWLSTAVHVLEPSAFQQVRTARNMNLINKEEQDKFYNSTIGIAGLSVGNSVALAIALQGGGKHVKLADQDTLALTNTNRVRAGIQNLGLLKVVVTARQIYEMNPYAHVEIFPEGITEKNIGKFFEGLDLIIDELDNLAVKFLLREHAKKNKIALLMAADNGDNAVVDIERYDLRPEMKFFHGRMGKVTYEGLKSLDKFGIGKMITKHIGAENVTERMKGSLLEMGKTIVSWPQLGGAALLNGSAVAYCARKVLNSEPLEGNRSLLSLDEKLIPNYNSKREVLKRKKSAEQFKKIFGL